MTIKQRRVKVAGEYFASGYGRGLNKKNVYEIDGAFYAYHPEYYYDHNEETGEEFRGYVHCIKLDGFNGSTYHAKTKRSVELFKRLAKSVSNKQ